MIESKPSFFWVVAHFVEPTQVLHSGLPRDTISEILSGAKIGLEMFLAEPNMVAFMPKSSERARVFLDEVKAWLGLRVTESAPAASFSSRDIGEARIYLRIFSQSVQDELDQLRSFTITAKGNLSIDCLTDGLSSGYPKFARDAMDVFISREIDEAGKCLAAGRSTASGFHILRSVETAIKGYVLAATGNLPPIKNRNWGTYIDWLTNANASTDVLDALRVLKTKRNPLMHPKDTLEEHEAISILCISQATVEALMSDITAKQLQQKFANALSALPTL